MTDAYIFDAVRTPRGRGKADGALHEITPVDLAAQTLGALRDRSDLDTSKIDDIVLGCVMPVGEQGADIARLAALKAGYDEKRRASRSTASAPPASTPATWRRRRSCPARPISRSAAAWRA